MANDHPLPGDLIVREDHVHPGIAPLFVISIHPHRTISRAYSDFRTAVEHAQQVATKRAGQLQVWREVANKPPHYENLTK